jgi:hypothetical protein
MGDIGDVVFDHDLPTAGAIEIADLAYTGTRPHDVLPRSMIVHSLSRKSRRGRAEVGDRDGPVW